MSVPSLWNREAEIPLTWENTVILIMLCFQVHYHVLKIFMPDSSWWINTFIKPHIFNIATHKVS